MRKTMQEYLLKNLESGQSKVPAPIDQQKNLGKIFFQFIWIYLTVWITIEVALPVYDDIQALNRENVRIVSHQTHRFYVSHDN